MPGFLDNLELGATALYDKFAGSHHAADLYAEQVAAEHDLSAKEAADLDQLARAAEDKGEPLTHDEAEAAVGDDVNPEEAADLSAAARDDAKRPSATPWLVAGSIVAGAVGLVAVALIVGKLA